MAYTEIKERNGRKYFYRVLSVREGDKVNKIRKYLGVNLDSKELHDLEEKADKMKKLILRAVKKLEKEYDVKILWAIESGSRAWGFASEDSDYDVRCVHVAKLDNYLGLYQIPQQINLSKDDIDLESWDIKKFAELSIKSNPQIAEWLRSPIIYINSSIRSRLRSFFDNGCSLEFLKQHYLRMAKQNYHKYMSIGMSHSCKKYLYVLRAIACASYIEKENKLPPLPYKQIINHLPEYVRDFFEKCVIEKNRTEKATILANERVSHFIDYSLNKSFGKVNTNFINTDGLNKFLIKTIKNNR